MRYYRARPKKGTELLIAEFMHRLETTDSKVIGQFAQPWSRMLLDEVNEWCIETYGKAFEDWAYGYRGGKFTLYFKSKHDAMAFKLRWM